MADRCSVACGNLLSARHALFCFHKELNIMKRSYPLRHLLALLLLFSLPALACGLTGGTDANPTPELPAGAAEAGAGAVSATNPATAPERPAEAPAFTDLQSAVAALDQFDSYRMDMTITFDGTSDGESRSGTMRFQSAFLAEPRSSQVILTFDGNLGGDMEGVESLTFTEIGDRSYTIFPGFGCMTGSADETGAMGGEFDDFADTENILGEIQSAEYVGEETINGVRTFHYRFDENDVAQDGDFDEMEGHIYIAQENRYVVRMVVDGRGKLDLFDDEEVEDGAIRIEYLITDVNAPLVIEPPAECAGAGSEYPVMDGATGLSSMAGFMSYDVSAPLEEVIAFYESQMAALGYSSGDSQTIFAGGAFLSFLQNGTTINVTLSEDGGAVSVLITSTDE
jgi:hypothetical protein